MNSKRITDLYASGEISGYAYLNCVENNIYTVQDAVDSGLLQEESCAWGKELRQLLEAVPEEDSNSSQEPTEEGLKRIIQDGLSKLSVRSRNALDTIFYQCEKSYMTFFEHLLSPDFVVKDIKNIGRKSTPEIDAFITSLRTIYSYKFSQHKEAATENLDDYNAIFETRLKTLSVRSFHAVDALFTSCGRSVSAFMNKISERGFKVSDLPAVGRKSSVEIERWINSFRELINLGEEGKGEAEKSTRISRYVSKGVRGNCEAIDSKCEELGYFPYFLAIQSYIDSLDSRDKAIIERQIEIYNNKTVENRKETAKALHITPERTRQLRNSIAQELYGYVSTLRAFKEVYPDFIYDKGKYSQINTSEGTAFNDNFVCYVLATIWPERYTLVGDADVAFMNPYGYEKNLVLVSAEYSEIFDFGSFMEYFERLSQEKRVEDSILSVPEIVHRFFKGRVYFEYIDDIVKECKEILERLFLFEVIGAEVHISKNASRNNTEWAELIIREAGHPMAIEEIYAELEKRNPGKSKSVEAFAGAIRNNPNLVPYGRSSTYGLKEWSEGSSRGGTIREFVTEYLLALPCPIATLEDIGKYVRQYRSSSSDKSIHANLMLEANDAFSVYYKDGVRHIGLTNYEYSDEYRKFEKSVDSKRSFEMSCTLLEAFVAEHGRLPFSSNVDDEEMRLARFWGVQQSFLKGGRLNEEESAIIRAMQNKFEGLKVNKKDYDWRQRLQTIKNALMNGFSITSLSSEKQRWLAKQIQNYKYGRLTDERHEMITEILNLLDANAKRI